MAGAHRVITCKATAMAANVLDLDIRDHRLNCFRGTQAYAYSQIVLLKGL